MAMLAMASNVLSFEFEADWVLAHINICPNDH